MSNKVFIAYYSDVCTKGFIFSRTFNPSFSVLARVLTLNGFVTDSSSYLLPLSIYGGLFLHQQPEDMSCRYDRVSIDVE
jgi:hypothetical protein